MCKYLDKHIFYYLDKDKFYYQNISILVYYSEHITDLNMMLARDTQLLISLCMLYKRPPMLFQWLLLRIKPQTYRAIFNLIIT